MADLADRTFAALMEAAPDAMLCVAGDGQVTHANGRAERLFGYRKGKLAGEPIENLVPEASRAIHRSDRTRYQAGPKSRPMGAGLSLTARRKDGRTFPVEISLSAVPLGAGTIIAATVRDITGRLAAEAEHERLVAQAERDRAERQALRAHRLESLGELAGGIAHDFNNLLAVITNYNAFVREEVAALEPRSRWNTTLDDLDRIGEAAGQAAELTHQLLTFARREVSHPRVINLNNVITNAQPQLAGILGEKITLITGLAPDLCLVRADSAQIEEVLVNLAKNSRDAMPRGGTVWIGTANTELSEGARDLPGGRYATVQVRDSGIGIPAAIIDRVFEPFFTTKVSKQGAGLGLATAHGIVGQAGGHLSIESDPGAGTTATIVLPVTDQPAPRPPVRPRRQGHGENVLVVDDEESLREGVQRILSRNGYQPVPVADGLAALAVLADPARPMDVLLTDVVMPHMPGGAVAREARHLRPEIRVLFMTGHPQGQLGGPALEEGIYLLKKPFTPATLLAKLREVLDAPPPGPA